MAILRTANLFLTAESESGEVNFNGACYVRTKATDSRIHISMLDRDGKTVGKLRLNAFEALALARSLMLGADQIEHDGVRCLSMDVH